MPMTGQECFAVWAPDESPWSVWAKPVLFAQEPMMPADPPGAASSAPSAIELPDFLTGAIVVNLPGAEAVTAGAVLAERGFRPVPLFNGTSGPGAVVAVDPIRLALGREAHRIAAASIAPEAPPAFLLDSLRMPVGASPAPGAYDNRWIILPQDCPSAVALLSRGIRQVTLIQPGGGVADDLAHVLRRWQEGGIAMQIVDIARDVAPRPLDVPRPPRFRWMWYAALAAFGLRRSNVGGFGSQIPVQSGRSGFYG